MSYVRQATREEAQQIQESERRAFGMQFDYCQSIPPRHTPHTAGDGHTYCTTCGEDVTDEQQ